MIRFHRCLAAASASLLAAPLPAQETQERLDELQAEIEELRAELEVTDPELDGPQLDLHGFAQTLYEWRKDEGHLDTSTSSGYSIGQMVLFPTARITDKTSFLSELVFTAGSEHGGQNASIERLIMTQRLNDLWSVQAGRFHTALGYWNNQFHHGEFLQTTIGRPDIFAFEHDGGPMPVHLVGAQLQGGFHTDPADIQLTAQVGNGRPAFPGTQSTSDANRHKAVTLASHVRPGAVPGLQVGASAYFDRIPPNEDEERGELHPSIDETLLVGHVVYTKFPYEILLEGMHADHDGDISSGYYLQLGYTYEDLTPFVRFDAIEKDDDDLFYPDRDDTEACTVGVRWDINNWAALKGQWTFGNRTLDLHAEEDSHEDEEQDLSRFSLQLSVAF